MWPTAELHVHIEGTLEPELLVTLARRNGAPLPSSDPDHLRTLYAFNRLQDFLDIYYRHLDTVRTAQDFHDLADAYFRRAQSAGVRRAEVFFDLQAHLRRGIRADAVFEGLGAALDAARARGLSADLILCFLRDLGPDAAMQTLETALPFRERFIGVGLDSAEVGFPPSLFREVYARAAAEGLHRVAHAGEEGGPDYIWEAIDLLGVERVDHGNRALEDAELVRRLRDDRIPLTVCPLSNLALRTAPADLALHPLPVMIEEGLLVSVHSDDPAYFGGYVDDNIAAVAQHLDLGPAALAALARNAFRSSFAPRDDVERWVAEVDDVLASRNGDAAAVRA
ncbi:MAG: adenine deaminase [Microbacterium sp.]|jgi:adenosine deaminase|nr:adenine deaminase [Microbacterium sp.]